MPFSPSHVAAPYPLPLSTQPHNHEAVEHAKFVIQPSTKAVYSNALQLLLTINLAAGLASWVTQFLLTCEHARLHILVTLSYLILIANVLGLLFAFAILYPISQTSIVHGFRSITVNYHLALVVCTMCLTFILFVCAAMAGYEHHVTMTVPYIGIALTAVLILGIFMLMSSTLILQRNAEKRLEHEEGPRPQPYYGQRGHKTADVPKIQRNIILLISAVETLVVAALLIYGTIQAFSTPTHVPCDSMTPEVWASGPMPVSIVGSENASATPGMMAMSGSTTAQLIRTMTTSASISIITDPTDFDEVETVVEFRTSTVYAPSSSSVPII